MRTHTHRGQTHEIIGAGDRANPDAEIAFCLSCGFESDGEHCSGCCGGALLGCDEFACRGRLLPSIIYSDEVRRGIRPHWSAT